MTASNVPRATTMLTTPPMSASTTDSVRSCARICPRVAPRERRTAISIVRFAERASSRLAMFAHAMSSTMPVIEKSRKIGVLAFSKMLLWPRRPSVTVISLALKRAIVASLIPFCRGASTSVMIG
jgi:hypothetical protein